MRDWCQPVPTLAYLKGWQRTTKKPGGDLRTPWHPCAPHVWPPVATFGSCTASWWPSILNGRGGIGRGQTEPSDLKQGQVQRLSPPVGRAHTRPHPTPSASSSSATPWLRLQLLLSRTCCGLCAPQQKARAPSAFSLEGRPSLLADKPHFKGASPHSPQQSASRPMRCGGASHRLPHRLGCPPGPPALGRPPASPGARWPPPVGPQLGGLKAED
jgi:hypothetical protein